MSTALDRYNPETGEVLEAEHATPIAAVPGIVRAELDALITTARIFPRSVTKSLRDAQTLATIDEEVASRCFYAVPRDGKTIDGPSARLAEILAAAWGNLRVTGRVVEETDRFIVAQGTCVDLQTNNGRQVEVRRRITDRRGRRYSDDMIVTTANAAIAIATRNAILAVIPRALWESVYQAARKTASGKMESIEAKRTRWLEHWKSAGVSEQEVYAALNIKGKSDIGLDQIATMVGWNNAIEDDAATIGGIFRPEAQESNGGQSATAKLAQQLKTQRDQRSQKLDHPHQRSSGQTAPPVTQAEADAAIRGQEELPFEPGARG